MRKSYIILGLVMALLLAFTIPGMAIKIAPYSQPLHDIMHWDVTSAKLIIQNPEGESQTVSWPATVDLWNYNGNTWTFDLPSGDKFAFSKRVDVNVSTTEGAGSTVRGISLTDTVGAALAIHEGIRSHVTSAFMTGSWTNALAGVITYSAAGSAGGGMAASICAEMNMQPAASSGGSYFTYQSYFNVPTSATLIDTTTNNYAFELYELAGGAKAQFDDYGDFWTITGLTPLADHVLSAQYITLRTTIAPAGTYYDKFLVMSDTQNMIKFTQEILNGANGDTVGNAVDIQMNYHGIGTGHVGLASFMIYLQNTDTVAPNANVCPLQVGIDESGADVAVVTDAHIIFGMRMHGLIAGADYNRFCPFSINTSNRSITALFDIASGPAISFVIDTDETGANWGYVPLFVDPAGTIGYVRIYGGMD